MKAAPFLVQEVPLPFSPHPAGAAWLKLKATAPPIGGVFDHHGAFYQQTTVRGPVVLPTVRITSQRCFQTIWCDACAALHGRQPSAA